MLGNVSERSRENRTNYSHSKLVQAMKDDADQTVVFLL